jgi:cellulose synthase/poly-beta-1,6-N-acetylglucosamine synthase-like glycosyltransferase
VSREEKFASAVVVIDADTTVSQNLLRTFDVAIGHGAQAVQAEYGVRNPESGWRTRLMSIALSTHHRLRNLARERMKLSVGLHGNGMAFTHSVLVEVPHDAFSVVEDLEYGIRLGYAGHRVHYAQDGAVFGEMVASERASRTQRERWEGGRMEMFKTHAKRLFLEGFKRRDPVLIDLGMDLLVPPLAYVATAAGVGLIAASGIVLLFPVGKSIVLPWLIASIGVGGYVARGVSLSPRGARAVFDLAWAPVYVGWKFALKMRSTSGKPTEWIRTERNT